MASEPQPDRRALPGAVRHPAGTTAWHDYRGYAGQVAGGVLKKGDEVMHLPSGLTTRIYRIDTARGPVPEAYPPMSVTLVLEDDLDISRGDMICRPHNQPLVSQDVEAHGVLDVGDPAAEPRGTGWSSSTPRARSRPSCVTCTTGST